MRKVIKCENTLFQNEMSNEMNSLGKYVFAALLFKNNRKCAGSKVK